MRSNTQKSEKPFYSVKTPWSFAVQYAADYPGGDPDYDGAWRPSIHMPRWASRDTLEVISARPERLQSITEAGAIAEGLTIQMGDVTGPGPGCKWSGPGFTGINEGSYHVDRANGICCCLVGQEGGMVAAVCAYAELWDSINGKKMPWAKSPWVWVVQFRRLERTAA